MMTNPRRHCVCCRTSKTTGCCCGPLRRNGEVRNLIAKLSESADGTLVGADRVRVLEARSHESTLATFGTSKQSWAGENELEIDIPEGGIASQMMTKKNRPKGTTEEADKVTSQSQPRLFI